MRRFVAVFVVAIVFTAACGTSADRVVVAAGTTLVDSGFIEAVVGAYAEQTGDDSIVVVGRSSSESVSLARSGDADLIITHEPAVLAEFIRDVPGSTVTEPFASRFIVVAPSGWSIGEQDVFAAFSAVAARGGPFVSRDDGSGTNARELEVWDAIDIDPVGEGWYIRAGAGMGATLLVAAERDAVTLAELGAFLGGGSWSNLTEVPLADPSGLENPYQVTVPGPAPDAHAKRFQHWLSSESGRQAIISVNSDLFGFQVYAVP